MINPYFNTAGFALPTNSRITHIAHYNMQNCYPLTSVGVYFQVFSADAHKNQELLS